MFQAAATAVFQLMFLRFPNPLVTYKSQSHQINSQVKYACDCPQGNPAYARTTVGGYDRGPLRAADLKVKRHKNVGFRKNTRKYIVENGKQHSLFLEKLQKLLPWQEVIL